MSNGDFQKKYLDKVQTLLSTAYKNKDIHTNITSDQVQVTISIPRAAADGELIDLLSQLYKVPT
jgi:hypothetical protein